ncbi:MAG: hypothetical protein RL594_183 [Bacteroidota bacterium]
MTCHQTWLHLFHGLINTASCFVMAIAMSCTAIAIELTPAQRAQIQAAVESMQKQMGVKGVSVAVITQNEALTATAGESYAGRSVSADMVFGIGSVTKTLTATTLVRMQEEGLLDLDQPLSTWIASHPNIDPTITVRELLGHRSGLADFSLTQEYRAAVLANTTRVFAPTELLSFVKEPLAARGTVFNYCNTNYVLAGMIIQAITGKSPGDAYRRYIFSGLQMDSTFMGVEDSIPVEIAVRWMGSQSGQNVSMNAAFSGAWTAGAAFSTAREIAVFMRALHRGAIVAKTSLEEMHTYSDTVTYGLGVSRQVLSGNVVLGHTGSIRGYESIVLYVPSMDIGLSVLVNQAPSSPVAIAAELLKTLAGTTSVQTTSNTTISVYPNPCFENITIHGLNENASVRIYTMQGTCCREYSSDGGSAQSLNVADLPSGTYVMYLQDDQSRHVMPLHIHR